jgi:hypothetical protein
MRIKGKFENAMRLQNVDLTQPVRRSFINGCGGSVCGKDQKKTHKWDKRLIIAIPLITDDIAKRILKYRPHH